MIFYYIDQRDIKTIEDFLSKLNDQHISKFPLYFYQENNIVHYCSKLNSY